MIRDRIKGLRRVRAGDLRPSPKNWRTHPAEQRAALTGVLKEIGWADAVLARETDNGTLELVDGHLRAGLEPDAEVPVLVLDVDEGEAEKLLLSIDPIASMASANGDALRELMDRRDDIDDAVRALLKPYTIKPPDNTDWIEAFERPESSSNRDYVQITFTIPRERIADWEAALEASGGSKEQFLLNAIDNAHSAH
jgi:hypothetical protein